jgi:hypothetical protein
MATIKIYDPNSSDNSIEVFNSGSGQDGEAISLQIDHDGHPKNYLYFDLTRFESVELINYLIKQFGIKRTEITF